ncbi:MAG TPA: hypothetical protein VG326_04655 [Tepidisphaeraceae bacterium]|jgi:hypothetical protein|nr:hypothetical protein [Tepidisphaeraceae bacterium]
MPWPLIHTSIALFIALSNDQGNSPWYGSLMAALGVASLGWLGFHAWHNKDDFRITVRRGKVRFHGRLPRGQRGRIVDFLLRDVAPSATVRVIGNWAGQGVLKVSVQGALSPGDRQRIRNFMKLTLKG